jgi:hypothetical protein
VHDTPGLLALRTGKPVEDELLPGGSFRTGTCTGHSAWPLALRVRGQSDGRLSTAGPTSCSTAARTPLHRRGGRQRRHAGSGPVPVPSVHVDARGVYTHNPPCGAMRGFGCVQAAFAHEALMDALARPRGRRPRRDRGSTGMPRGATRTSPVSDRLRPPRWPSWSGSSANLPLPPPRTRGRPARPARRGLQHHPRRGRRARGSATRSPTRTSDSPRARRLLDRPGAAGDPRREPWPRCTPRRGGRARADHRRAQICRTELASSGWSSRPGHPGGSGGSTSASAADLRDRGRCRRPARGGARAARGPGVRRRRTSCGRREVGRRSGRCSPLATSRPRRVEESVEWRPPADQRSTRDRQGDAHVSSPSPRTARGSTSTSSSGLVKVVALDTAQDVGQGDQPDAVVGQIHGGSRAGHGAGADGGGRGDRRARAQTRRSPTTCCRRSSTCRRCRSRCSSTPTRTRPTACAGWGSRRRSPPGPAVAAAVRAACGRPLRRVPIRRSTSRGP